MKTIAAIGVGLIAGWFLLAAPAVDGAAKGGPLEAHSRDAPLFSAVGTRLTNLAESFLRSPGEPSYEDMWISREKLHRLAKYHGTNALKITGTKVYIWRDNKWIAVLAR